MSALVWSLEWRLAVSSGRNVAAGIVAPLSLVLVIVSGATPAAGGAAAYVAIFVAFGVYCTAIPIKGDGERGMVFRVVRGGISPPSYLLQRAASGAALSFVQLLPSFAVVAVFLHASVGEVLVALSGLAVTLWISGLLGVFAAAVSRSRTEVTLVCGVAALLLLHMSGVFHTPVAGGFGAILEGAAPFRALHEAFLTMISGGAVGGGIPAVIWAVVLPALVGLGAPRLTRSLQSSG